MQDVWFGAWAGTAINDTSQVVAAGFSYSDAAGEAATTIKLVRNIMIVPVVFLVSFFFNRHSNAQGAEHKKFNFIKAFPTFILGFFAACSAEQLRCFFRSRKRRTYFDFKIHNTSCSFGDRTGCGFQKVKRYRRKAFFTSGFRLR